MDAIRVSQIYLNAATREFGYSWYGISPGTLYAAEPSAYTSSLRELVAHDTPTAVLYHHGGDELSNWGVFWGPMPTGQLDWIGRDMAFRLLVEVDDFDLATGIFGGILRDWWPRQGKPAAEFGPLLSGALAGSAGGADRLLDAFIETFRNWYAVPVKPVSGAVIAREPRIAQPSPERLAELENYLRGPFRDTGLLRSLTSSVVVDSVVTGGIVDGRLRDIWRVLNDRAPSDDWVVNKGAHETRSSTPMSKTAGAQKPRESNVGGFLDTTRSPIVGYIRGFRQRLQDRTPHFLGDEVPHPKSRIQDLIDQLTRGEVGDERVQAAESLGRLAPTLNRRQFEAIIDALILVLDPSADSPPKVLRAAVRALGNIGPGASRARADILRLRDNLSVTDDVCQALNKIG